jgi:hypothetical protein
MSALKEKGLVEDKDKFNLMMQILDGDKEALKQHIKNLGMDPVEDLDLEDGVNYEAKDFTTNETRLVYEDMLEVAKDYGNEGKVQDILMRDWDSESAGKVLSDPGIRSAFLTQVNNGVFDEVQEIIQKLEIQDRSGQFAELSSYDKYQEASEIWNQVNANNVNMAEPEPDVNYKQAVLDEMTGNRGEMQQASQQNLDPRVVEMEKQLIEQQRELEQYRAKIEAKERKTIPPQKSRHF